VHNVNVASFDQSIALAGVAASDTVGTFVVIGPLQTRAKARDYVHAKELLPTL